MCSVKDNWLGYPKYAYGPYFLIQPDFKMAYRSKHKFLLSYPYAFKK